MAVNEEDEVTRSGSHDRSPCVTDDDESWLAKKAAQGSWIPLSHAYKWLEEDCSVAFGPVTARVILSQSQITLMVEAQP